MKKTHQVILPIVCFMTLFLLFPAKLSADNGSAGILIRSEGSVSVFRLSANSWIDAEKGMSLQPGDRIQTGADGWAALLLADESMVQVSRNSLFILKQVQARAGWLEKIGFDPGRKGGISRYLIEKGRIWLRNKNRNQQIDIDTPYVSTSIRGTELDIEYKTDGSTHVQVLEGMVNVANSRNEILLNAMEQVVGFPDQPLEKTMILKPDDAVQWTISFEPFLDLLARQANEKETIGLRWQQLISGSPEKALAEFEQGSGMDDRVGAAAACAIMRQYARAVRILDQGLKTNPDHVPGLLLKALLLLVKNDREPAADTVARALVLAPKEPVCHVVNAWIRQAGFDLEGAMAATQSALQIEPENIPALINLSRLHFASGFLEDSMKAVNVVLERDPGYAEALNIKGFLLLAMHRDDAAEQVFLSAVEKGPYLGEPHLGLCLIYMRLGDEARAQQQVTTAVLLEPQRSVFVSYWAKMLYQKKRFRQSLDMLAHARRLDPNDPTPWLYMSHVLRDLNRIHEAIHALQKAMELNNNQAVYKSSFFLDQDLAVQNVNLAELFKKLGVSEWGSTKAMASMKKNYNNFAAHDFLAGQLDYLHGPSSFGARSARARSFLMKPANANTLNTFNNYTLFFDQPSVNATTTGWFGSKGYWNGQVNVNGAVPRKNTAFDITVQKSQEDGWQRHDWINLQKINASVKWDATYRDTLSLETEHYSYVRGDLSSQTVYDALPDENIRKDTDYKFIRAGYVRKFSPDANFLFMFQRDYKYHKFAQTHLDGTGTVTIAPFTFDYVYDYDKYEWLDDPFTHIQAMQTYRLKDHMLSAGGALYESDRNYIVEEVTNTNYYWAGTSIFAFNTLAAAQITSCKPKKMQTVYVQDVWNPLDSLTIEAAVYVDKIFNVNSKDRLTWSKTYLNPRAGVTFRPTPDDTFSVSYKEFLEPFESVARIDAVEVAGHILPGFYEGAVIREVAVSLEHEWGTGIFLAKCFVNEPTYNYLAMENGTVVGKELDQKYVGFESAVNQLVSNDMALSAGYTFFSIDRDRVTPLLEGENNWYWARLTRMLPSGLAGSLGASYYDTDYDDPSQQDRSFLILTGYIEYEFPQKRGKLRLEMQNMLDKHFTGVPLSNLAGLRPHRNCVFMLELNF